MTAQPIIGVVTNPNSKKNSRIPNRAQKLEQLLGRHGIVRQTKDVDELPKVIREFQEVGCRYWVCDGGDGTLHWMLNTGCQVLAEQHQHPWEHLRLPTLVPTNGGTVDFVARKAKLRGNAESIVSRLVKAVESGEPMSMIKVDTLQISGTKNDDISGEKQFQRVGMAAALGGVAQNFFDRFYFDSNRNAARIATIVGSAAVSAVLDAAAPRLMKWLPKHVQGYATDFFRPLRAKIHVNGRHIAGQSFSALQVGAIDINLAGVVRCFRLAKEDGVLHFQALCTSPLGIVANVPSMVFGTPVVGKQVFDDRVEKISIVAAPEERIDPVVDGERFFGLKEIEVSLGPSLRIPTL